MRCITADMPDDKTAGRKWDDDGRQNKGGSSYARCSGITALVLESDHDLGGRGVVGREMRSRRAPAGKSRAKSTSWWMGLARNQRCRLQRGLARGGATAAGEQQHRM